MAQTCRQAAAHAARSLALPQGQAQQWRATCGDALLSHKCWLARLRQLAPRLTATQVASTPRARLRGPSLRRFQPDRAECGQAVAPLVEERADLVRRLSSRAVQLCDQLHVVGLVALADEAVEVLADERPHHAIGSG